LRSRPSTVALPALSALLSLLLVPAGCTSAPRGGVHGYVPTRDDARRLPTYDGDDGARLTWDDLMKAVGEADVVILGEQHDDAVGHAVQLAVVEDAAEAWPGTALSMEMLERDEQRLVDDYVDGIIDAKQFARLTNSERWGGRHGSWFEWYQPIVDAAKDGEGTIVAANAPRRYVRLARTDGYERIDELPAPRRTFVEIPPELPTGAYRDRFWDVMTPDEDETSDVHAVDEETLQKLFRSQLVWDATMAGSIADAKVAGAPKVVHLIGCFHSDFDGGTVQQLRRRLPDARVLVVSMLRGWPDGLRDEDRGRADIVIYTGER
jgi:uncharacterized iron-regulated protein